MRKDAFPSLGFPAPLPIPAPKHRRLQDILTPAAEVEHMFHAHRLYAELNNLAGKWADDFDDLLSDKDRGLRAQAPGQPARAHALVGARARARRPQQQHQRDNARASGARAGSVGSGLSHVGQSDVGHSPHPPTHTHAHSYQPVCITNTYYLTYPPPHTRRASRA